MLEFDPETRAPLVDHRVEQIRAHILPASSASEISSEPYLVKHWIDADGVSMVFGASNTGKSFFALDLAMHVASGCSWQGRKVSQGHVIYVAAEGGRGFTKRIKAIEVDSPALFGAARDHFSYVPLQLDMHGAEDTEALLLALCDRPVDLLIFDTFAMSMGNGSENEARDITKFLTNMNSVRQQFDCHVMIVHHSGKDSSRGARGHSSLRAAINTEIELKAEGVIRIASNSKQRENAKQRDVAFSLKTVVVGKDTDAEDITSCVVEVSDVEVAKLRKRKTLSGNNEVALQALRDAIRTTGFRLTDNPDFPASRKLVTVEAWRRAFFLKREAEDVKTQSVAKSFERAQRHLIDSDYVRKEGDRVWLVDHEADDQTDTDN
jgi:archaellum biogenesis ATPase FlaH